MTALRMYNVVFVGEVMFIEADLHDKIVADLEHDAEEAVTRAKTAERSALQWETVAADREAAYEHAAKERAEAWGKIELMERTERELREALIEHSKVTHDLETEIFKLKEVHKQELLDQRLRAEDDH